MLRRVLVLAALLCSLPLLLAQDKPTFPGPTDKGFLLPNGWTLTPAGKHVTLADLPLNIVPLADNKHALVSTSGFNKHELSLVDLTTQKLVTSETVRQSWFGLALTPAEDKVWWAGGGAPMLHTFDLTVLTDDASSIVYVLLVRCTSTCRSAGTALTDHYWVGIAPYGSLVRSTSVGLHSCDRALLPSVSSTDDKL
jgi:hypothetical protein